MAEKSDSDLQYVLDNQEDYQQAAVEAAASELERRGATDIEVIEVPKPSKASFNETFEVKKKKSNYTDDPNAPELYPKWSIWVMSGLFSPLFGGIMMAMNFNRTGDKKQIPIVIGFSILFLFLVVTIVEYAQEHTTISSNLTNLLNLGGAAVLDFYFWNSFIGKEFKYRKRSPLIPIIIGVVISGLYIWLLLTLI